MSKNNERTIQSLLLFLWNRNGKRFPSVWLSCNCESNFGMNPFTSGTFNKFLGQPCGNRWFSSTVYSIIIEISVHFIDVHWSGETDSNKSNRYNEFVNDSTTDLFILFNVIVLVFVCSRSPADGSSVGAFQLFFFPWLWPRQTVVVPGPRLMSGFAALQRTVPPCWCGAAEHHSGPTMLQSYKSPTVRPGLNSKATARDGQVQWERKGEEMLGGNNVEGGGNENMRIVYLYPYPHVIPRHVLCLGHLSVASLPMPT